jgi:hypothetical protein
MQTANEMSRKPRVRIKVSLISFGDMINFINDGFVMISMSLSVGGGDFEVDGLGMDRVDLATAWIALIVVLEIADSRILPWSFD